MLKQYTQDGLRSDLPYAHHYNETFHTISVYDVLIIAYRIDVVQDFHLAKAIVQLTTIIFDDKLPSELSQAL